MKDLKKVKVGITHGGRFHLDDVISTVFIKSMVKDLEVKRVLEYEDNDKEEEIVYDIGLGEFDHHDSARKINDNGTPYSAFGLLFETYGRAYLLENGFKDIENAFNYFKKHYVFKVDQGDNGGYKNVEDFFDNEMLLRCNALWFEEDEEAQFKDALVFGEILLDTWTRETYQKIEEEGINETI